MLNAKVLTAHHPWHRCGRHGDLPPHLNKRPVSLLMQVRGVDELRRGARNAHDGLSGRDWSLQTKAVEPVTRGLNVPLHTDGAPTNAIG